MATTTNPTDPDAVTRPGEESGGGVKTRGPTTTVRRMSEMGSQLEISSLADGWKLSGEVDAHTAPTLANAMVSLPPGLVKVDMQGVSFMDSSGLRVLME